MEGGKTMKAFSFIVLGVCVLLTCGCDRDLTPSYQKQIAELKEENQQLSKETTGLKEENLKLNEQVETLSGFESGERQKALPTLSKIAIAKRSGFVDKDDDNVKEKLVVYVKPYDSNLDVIKAAGSVTVQLWDLEQTSAKAMLKEWVIAPQELSKMWMGAFMTDYYRLLFDVDPSGLKVGREYTIKVTFTDYISGKVFKEQKVVTLN
jgi:FtsZ-binding cell division protein ZapB